MSPGGSLVALAGLVVGEGSGPGWGVSLGAVVAATDLVAGAEEGVVVEEDVCDPFSPFPFPFVELGPGAVGLASLCLFVGQSFFWCPSAEQSKHLPAFEVPPQSC